MNIERIIQTLTGQRTDVNQCGSVPRSKLFRLLNPTGHFGYQEAEDYPPGSEDITEKIQGEEDGRKRPKGT